MLIATQNLQLLLSFIVVCAFAATLLWMIWRAGIKRAAQLPVRPKRNSAMLIGVIAALAALVYLVYTLLRPEKF